MEVLGGSGEIRTHGSRKTSPVFKTGAFNRSATLPRVEACYSNLEERDFEDH